MARVRTEEILGTEALAADQFAGMSMADVDFHEWAVKVDKKSRSMMKKGRRSDHRFRF